MRTSLLAAVLSLVADAPRAQPAATGSIQGQVLVVQDGKTVPVSSVNGGVWVWLVDKTHPLDPDRKLPSQSIVQVKQTFVPHVLVVPKGTKIEFPNKDSETHNVFSPSPYFDLGRYAPGKTPFPYHVFKAATPRSVEIEIYCDIHKCMWARLKVVDAAGPDDIQQVSTNGRYEFKNLAPGTYEVWAWAVASQEVTTHELTVAGKPVQAPNVKIPLGTLNTDHKNKDGQDYKDVYAGCR